MKTTDRLLERVIELWRAYNEHPFVKGIEDGSLSRESFRYYILQDYLYLKDYSAVFALGVAKARSIETARLFSDYISVMNGELDIHSGYMGRLGVTMEEIEAAKPSLENISYTSYMLRTAYEGGEAEILTAILPCAYSYELIAKRMVENSPSCINDDFYGAWIEGYASSDYAAGNVVLLDTLDRLTKEYTEDRLKKLEEIFVNCSRYELAFWDMSLKNPSEAEASLGFRSINKL